MKKSSLIKKMKAAAEKGCKFNELVIYGEIDDSKEQKWSSMSLGAFSDKQELSEQDRVDIKALLEEWIEYIKISTDDNTCGKFKYGNAEIIGFVFGDDGAKVAQKIAEISQKHWQGLAAKAIKDGMDSEIEKQKEASDGNQHTQDS